jgi:hypothetical protein
MVFFTFLERYSTGDREQRVPSFAYGQLTLCLLGTSYLSTVGLDLINYPTKVVFRSCKLIPTMAVAIVLHRWGICTRANAPLSRAHIRIPYCTMPRVPGHAHKSVYLAVRATGPLSLLHEVVYPAAEHAKTRQQTQALCR